MEEFQKTYIWNEAFDLTVKLNQLAEELPDQEAEFLGKHLRQSAIDVPTKLAEDFVGNQSSPEQKQMVRAEIELELVRRIYPAIDTAPADEALAKLSGRANSGNWQEAPAPAAADEEEPTEEDAGQDEADEAQAEPAAQPESVTHSIAVEEG